MSVQSVSRSIRRDRREYTRRRSYHSRFALESLETRQLLSVLVGTDQTDYAPGATALITGSGFVPNDPITLQVVHTDGNPDVSPANDPWTVSADSSGDISSSWYVDPASSTGDSLELQATDPATGDHAVADFTDANEPSQYRHDHRFRYLWTRQPAELRRNWVNATGTASVNETVITTGGTPYIALNTNPSEFAYYASGSGTAPSPSPTLCQREIAQHQLDYHPPTDPVLDRTQRWHDQERHR